MCAYHNMAKDIDPCCVANGGSRIPRLLPPEQRSGRHKRSSSAPTRFERLARNYKEKIQEEQDHKLSAIRGRPRYREKNPREGKNRFRGSSLASANIPPNRGNDPQGSGAVTNGVLPPPKTFGGKHAKPPLPGYTKRSAGRDKANPLPPLSNNHGAKVNSGYESPASRGGSANSGMSPKPPSSLLKRPKMVRPDRLNSRGSEVESGTDSDVNMNSANNRVALTPLEKAKLHKIRQREKSRLNYIASSDDEGHRSHRKTLSRGVNGQASPSSNRQLHSDPEERAQVSDFQKWQSEQDRARTERLENHYQAQRDGSAKSNASVKELGNTYTVPTDDESPTSAHQRVPHPPRMSPSGSGKPPRGPTHASSRQALIKAQKLQILNRQRTNKDIYGSSSGDDEESLSPEESEDEEAAQKQRELEAVIAKQEAELEKLQRERQAENEKERKEAERQRKRKASQKERQHRLREAQEQERLQRQEEERQAKSISPDAAPSPPESRGRGHAGGASSRQSSRNTSRQGGGGRRRSSVIVPARKPPSVPPKREPPAKARTPELNDNTAFYFEQAATAEASEGSSNLNLEGCPTCGRKFAGDRLAKHAKVCKTNAKKAPRKILDPSKMRLEGTELAQYADPRSKSNHKPKPKKKDWRAQHENFIKTIRYAKAVQETEANGGSLADLPPPPPAENPDYVACPHCQRRFNPSTAERHIPKCQNIRARPAPPKAKTSAKAKNKRY